MNARLKASVLWGVVGVMTFVVLVQAYELWAVVAVDLGVKVGVAGVIGLVAGGMTYVAEGWYQSRVVGEE